MADLAVFTINSLSCSSIKRHCRLCLTAEKAGAQRDQVTSPRSHKFSVVKQGWKLGLSAFVALGPLHQTALPWSQCHKGEQGFFSGTFISSVVRT